MGTADEWITKYVVYVDSIIDACPYKRMKVWKEFFFNPISTLRQNIDSIGQRIRDLYVSTGILVALGLIANLPSLVIGAIGAGSGAAFTLGSFLLLYALMLVFVPVLSFLYSAFEFLFAKLLGGKADLKTHFNASVLPSLGTFTVLLPLNIIALPLQWLQIIPGISICAGLRTLPISIVPLLVYCYGLYLKYLGFKEVHKISAIRAALV